VKIILAGAFNIHLNLVLKLLMASPRSKSIFSFCDNFKLVELFFTPATNTTASLTPWRQCMFISKGNFCSSLKEAAGFGFLWKDGKF